MRYEKPATESHPARAFAVALAVSVSLKNCV